MRKVARLFFNMLMLFLLSATLSACQEEKARLGATAPPLALYSAKGEAITLEQFKGKPLLINFWSQSCGMCIVELRTFAQFQQKYPQKMQVLAINIDGGKGNLSKLLAKENFPFLIGIDQMNITAERFQLVGTPTTFYLDSTGKILQKFESMIPDETLESLFKGQ